ncbi:unnamed protein product [Psylliodes chrysocephalus]|uniref:Adenosine deaminase n=1 Tax=Psylliodes chrysocephalus TaxID=3402493 RepID=A0A9P0GC21_9CUCU|nr:unnamed protein product [Psylliodes chrysocephala]
MSDENANEEDRCICEYIKKRNRLVHLSKNFGIGSQIKLTERESVVNDYLMKYKNEEMDKGFGRPDRFLPANHFFTSRAKIEKSKVFQFLRAMPKGASLHSHDLGMVSADYLYSLTFKENLYALVKDEELFLQFFKKKKVPKDQEWILVSELRENDPEFEDFLKSKLTLICENPDVAYPDVDTVWKSFQKLFINLEKLITYKPVFQEYFYQVLKEAYEENVKYLEFRGFLPNVYDIDGKTYRNADVVCLYWETLTQFLCEHVDFVGCKFIFAPHRLVGSEVMDEYVCIYKCIKEKFPRFVLGFDLVGQEDLGAPLINFIRQFLDLKESGCKFFFHAGETHWNGQPTDYNIFDAILLGSVRIGHAFALLKHPLAANLVKERGIGIEISPISNQVLKLIDDVRDHPAALMIANNYPVVIVNDDPSFWGGKGITYDWYVTFMGMCHRDADIRLLKQLALNSIQYSGLDDDEKDIAFAQFNCDWNKFLTRVLKGCECSSANKDCGK